MTTPEPESLRIPIENIRDGQCRWITSETTWPALMCGHEVKAGVAILHPSSCASPRRIASQESIVSINGFVEQRTARHRELHRQVQEIIKRDGGKEIKSHTSKLRAEMRKLTQAISLATERGMKEVR